MYSQGIFWKAYIRGTREKKHGESRALTFPVEAKNKTNQFRVFEFLIIAKFLNYLENITVIHPSKRKFRKPAARTNENGPLLVAVLLRSSSRSLFLPKIGLCIEI